MLALFHSVFADDFDGTDHAVIAVSRLDNDAEAAFAEIRQYFVFGNKVSDSFYLLEFAGVNYFRYR